MHNKIVEPARPYSGFWKRFLAYSIDSIIVNIIILSLGASISFGTGSGFSYFPGALIAAAYFIFFWLRDGQTLGNRLLAIKVVREGNQPLDISTGIIRYIGYLLSSVVFGLGFLWVIWDKKKQGWHDKIAKTLVIETGEKSRVGLAIAIVVISYLILLIVIIAVVAAIGLGAFALLNAQKQNPGSFKDKFWYEKNLQKNPLQTSPLRYQ